MTAEPGSDVQPRRLRIVLADDHQVVRHGLRLVLDAEPDFTVVAEAGDITSARAKVREHQPDVLVTDFHMPGASLLEAIPELRVESPTTQIVVLTMEADTASVRAARKAGAVGYVLKEAAHTDLAEAVRLAAAGQMYMNRRLAAKLVAQRILDQAPD
jgi:two-component system, NarL family, response regulator NreC